MLQILRHLLVGFYLFAGVYHFINPEFYYGLIPDYLPYPVFINYASGILEVVLAVGVAIPRYRTLSVKSLIVLLILFIPSHVYFIQMGSCVENGLCVSPWLSWSRLLIVHPLLMFWAWVVKAS